MKQPKKKPELVTVDRKVLLKARAALREYIDEEFRNTHVLNPEASAAEKALTKIIKESKKKIDRKQATAEWWDHWEKAGIGLDAGYTVPEMYYFAARPSGDQTGGENEGPVYELYLCFKGEYDLLNAFPWQGNNYMGRINRFPNDAVGDILDCDNGLMWCQGDIEKARAALIQAGFTEKPEILETLHRFPEDVEDEDRWS